MDMPTRTISWIKAARKAFDEFLLEAQERITDALVIAARGEKAGIAKPMRGFGSGVFEIALPYQGEAYRTVYAVQMGEEVWVIHAFQKKSTQGIKTPQREIDVIRERITRLKERLT
jgi:phage-related protein